MHGVASDDYNGIRHTTESAQWQKRAQYQVGPWVCTACSVTVQRCYHQPLRLAGDRQHDPVDERVAHLLNIARHAGDADRAFGRASHRSFTDVGRYTRLVVEAIERVAGSCSAV